VRYPLVLFDRVIGRSTGLRVTGSKRVLQIQS